MRIGVLGFQGAIIEHQRHIATLGHKPVVVRYPEQLKELDGIILPGGESTTMGKLLVRTGMMEPLRAYFFTLCSRSRACFFPVLRTRLRP